MNNRNFQDLVKGQYGRKTAYVDFTEVTPDNILKISLFFGQFAIYKILITMVIEFKIVVRAFFL